MQSEPADKLWCVAVYEAPRDPHVVAQILVDELRLPPHDALIHARYAPGVLSERLDRTQAESLAARLIHNQCPSEALAVSALPDFRHATVSHHVRLSAAGLVLCDLRGDVERTIPWDDIALISAGLVPLESTVRTDLDDVHFFSTARHSHHMPTVARLPPVMEAWLLDDSGLRVLRLDQTRMNYETLGDRKSDSAADNFRILLERLIAASTSADCTPATMAWKSHASLFQYLFDSSNKLQRITMLHWLKRTRRLASRESAASSEGRSQGDFVSLVASPR